MILIFKQNIKEITDNVQVLSQYRGNSLQQKGNNVPLDDTPVTLDDIKILKKYLKTGCMEINKVLSGYQSSIVNDEGTELLPFEFDVADPDIEIPHGETANPDNNVIIFRCSMPETFNTAVITTMDEAIRDALENYLLYRTSKHKMNEMQSYQQDFDEAKGLLRTYVNARTKSTRRTYNILE